MQATQCLVECHTQFPPGGMDFLPLNKPKYVNRFSIEGIGTLSELTSLKYISKVVYIAK